ncbi:MAG: MATE family efflux transporter [Bacillaceae bacterium]
MLVKYSRNNKKELKLLPYRCTKMAISMYIILRVTFFLFKDTIMKLLTNQQDLIYKALSFFTIAIHCLFISYSCNNI